MKMDEECFGYLSDSDTDSDIGKDLYCDDPSFESREALDAFFVSCNIEKVKPGHQDENVDYEPSGEQKVFT